MCMLVSKCDRTMTMCCVGRWCSWPSSVPTATVDGQSLRSRSSPTVCRTWTVASIQFSTRSCRSRFARTSDGYCSVDCVAHCSSLAVMTRWTRQGSVEPATWLWRRWTMLAINRWQQNLQSQQLSTNCVTSLSTLKTTPRHNHLHHSLRVQLSQNNNLYSLPNCVGSYWIFQYTQLTEE